LSQVVTVMGGSSGLVRLSVVGVMVLFWAYGILARTLFISFVETEGVVNILDRILKGGAKRSSALIYQF
jgi:hypothetical protein